MTSGPALVPGIKSTIGQVTVHLANQTPSMVVDLLTDWIWEAAQSKRSTAKLHLSIRSGYERTFLTAKISTRGDIAHQVKLAIEDAGLGFP